MLEKIRFILGEFGAFLWPLIKQFIKASAPAIKAAAMAAVQTTAAKYAGTLASNNELHEDAYKMIVNDLINQGLRIGVDFTESMIDTAIAAAVKQMK